LLAARFVGGLGASNIGSAQAVVTDVTPPGERARGMGLIGAAIGLGFVVGPALGGVLAPIGPAVPFWVAMGLAVINALLVMSFLPETRREKGRVSSVSRGSGGLLTGWGKTLRYPAVVRLVTINLLFTLAFAAMEAVFPLFTQHTFGWTARENGYIFTYVGFVVVLMQGGLVGRLVRRFGEHTLLIAGLAMLAIGLILLPWSTNLALLFISLGILSAGEGAVTPTVSALLSFVSPPEAQGETLGFAQGLAGLGRVVGPLAAGSLFAMAGPGSPFLIGGILVALAVVLALPALPARREAEETQTITEDARKSVRITRTLSEASKR
jgi:MFS family permease